MTIPDSAAGVLALLALLIPGAAFAYVRILLGGLSAADRDVQSRILQAVSASVAFDAAYLALSPRPFVALVQAGSSGLLPDPSAVGFGVLVYGVLVPAAVAIVLYYRPAWRWLTWISTKAFSWLAVFRRGVPYRAIPTAWDFAAPQRSRTFVRVRTPEGGWIGGWFGEGSFVSTYPEKRDLFIASQWEMSQDGAFQHVVPDSAGVWVAVGEGYVVEWVYDPADSPDPRGGTR